MRFETKINGMAREVESKPGETLLHLLRSLGFKSVKEGCDREGQCGACTVLIDGEPVISCLTPAPKAAQREVMTVEALGTPARPHVLQTAFVEAGAVQCGFCTPGMLLASKSLLDKNKEPTKAEIADALSGNLCRCTGYVKIAEAVENAAAALRKEASDEHK
jgi:aldehyde oxidoreductase